MTTKARQTTMAGDENENASNGAGDGAPSLQDIIAAQKAKLLAKLKAKSGGGDGQAAKAGPPAQEAAPGPAQLPKASEDEHHDVTEARQEAYEEALAQGASDEDARTQGDVAAEMVQTQLGYEAGKAAELAAEAAASGEHPEVTEARKEAYEEALAQGASDEDARKQGDVAAEMVQTQLGYEADKAAELAAEAAASGEHPEVTEARKEAYEEALGQGASEEEARKQGDVAAEMVQTQLGYEADKAAEAAAEAAISSEHPEVAEARQEAYEEALGQGASEEEARKQGDVAAEMVQTQLGYEADKAAEAAAEDKAEEKADTPEQQAEAPTKPVAKTKPSRRRKPSAVPVGAGKGGKRVSLLHVIMALNTALVAVVVGSIFGLLPGGLGRMTAPPEVSANMVPQPSKRSPEDPVGPEGVGPEVSDQAAESALAANDYGQAAQKYRRLLATSKSRGGDALLADFYRLRIGQCLEQLGEVKDARLLYQKVSRSQSPIVAAVASDALAGMDEVGGQYLLGRMRAYRAIAALRAVGGDSPLELDCDYLIGRALTRKVRSFHQAEDIIPWPQDKRLDPFTGLDQRKLGRLLRQGSVSWSVAGLGEKIQMSETPDAEGGRKWNVTCLRASVEEVIHQLASREKGDVKWVGVNPQARSRTISLNVRAMGARRLNEVICGMGGLIARFTMTGLEIHDPHSMTVMSKQRDLLAREAESVWRAFFLRGQNDPRVVVGRFALAGLSELAGDPAGAMQGYQVISRRHRNSAVAPEALVRCARIRMEKLRDYRGARTDLYDLMNLWPEYDRSAEVNVLLGRVAMKAGLLEEAIKTFKRLYHMNLSAESRQEACLGAGDCYRLSKDYQKAAVWMARYINLAKTKKGRNEDTARAYLVLGRAEAMSDRPDEALRAFRLALGWGPTDGQYVSAVLGVGRAWLAKETPVSALSALKALKDRKLEPGERRDSLLLAARAYRQMHLPEKAQMILAEGARRPDLADKQIRGQILVELSRCCVDTGDLKDARKWLLEALPRLEAGKANWEATIELAEICLKLGNPKQGVSLARELMKSPCDKAIRQRAMDILVRGHVSQQDYQGAVDAMEASQAKKKQGVRP